VFVFLKQHKLIILVIILSNGFIEWQHRGRKFQFFIIFGRHSGHLFCKMFIATIIITVNKRTEPITENTIVPANDKANTKPGKAINMNIR
jgi:putative SOS response-associated peptidase YedK